MAPTCLLWLLAVVYVTAVEEGLQNLNAKKDALKLLAPKFVTDKYGIKDGDKLENSLARKIHVRTKVPVP
jgi:hypothetical protein